jgi:hypothetical protein
MIYVYRLLVIVFIVSIPCWYVPVIVSDLNHPEKWDSDWMHDPRIYGWMFAGGVLFCLLLLWRVIRHNRRLNEMVRRAKARS